PSACPWNRLPFVAPHISSPTLVNGPRKMQAPASDPKSPPAGYALLSGGDDGSGGGTGQWPCSAAWRPMASKHVRRHVRKQQGVRGRAVKALPASDSTTATARRGRKDIASARPPRLRARFVRSP